MTPAKRLEVFVEVCDLASRSLTESASAVPYPAAERGAPVRAADGYGQ